MINYEPTREPVTRQTAQEWLAARHENQRPINRRHVDVMYRDMMNGEWHDIGDSTIKIDANGKLIDGQQRLTAFLKTGKDWMTFRIQRNFPEGYTKYVDTCIKTRSMSDVLCFSGVKYSTYIMPMLNTIMNYCRNRTVFSNKPPTIGETNRTYSIFEYDLEMSLECYKQKRFRERVPLPGIVGGLIAIFHHVENTKAREFANGLIEGRTERDTLFLLREMLSREKARRGLTQRQLVAAWVIKGWNLWSSGKIVSAIRITNDNGLPEVNDFKRPTIE